MDKRAIKNFAIEARKILIAGVTNKLSMLGITSKEEIKPVDKIASDVYSFGDYRFSGKDVKNYEKLVEDLNHRQKQSGNFQIAFETLVEEVAYTWFNRIIALRFMEVNDYLPEGMRVLSSDSPGKKEPEIITELLDTDLFKELDQASKNQAMEWIADGTAEAADKLYQLIFIKQCNSLNEQLPDLFEKIDDYTELLFTVSYIDENGVIAKLLTIPESDFDVDQEGQVEIIGWMYQYYNTEPKDKVFARGNRKIRADEIPAATQLFTPDWIVRYMVENSLGRYYIDQKLASAAETRTEKEIAEEFGWEYYLPTAEQPEDVQLQIVAERKEKSSFALQEIKLIDPSMGSGHILVYAFDVLMQMYEAEGEMPRTAAEMILEKNLFGLDIDKRAFQLAYFALMMKGRQYSRRILSKGIRPNVFAVPDNAGIGESELQLLHGEFPDAEKAHEDLITLTSGFQHGHDLGSLISFEGIDFENLKAGLAVGGLSFIDEAVHEMVLVGEVLQEEYTIGVTNPPYMGSSGMNKVLADFVKKIYPDSKSDLFGVFMERLVQMVKPDGYYAMITQHAWMFLSSFEKLRSKVNRQTIINMAHLGTRAFEEIGGEVVQTTAFVMSPKGRINYSGSYLRLVDFGNHELKETKTLEAIENGSVNYLYHTVQDNFKKIPGQPISYWVSENLIHDFVVGKRLGDLAAPRGGLTTGDNDRFLRQWFEVELQRINFKIKDNEQSKVNILKWVPIDKGGTFRKWYGNYDYIINWEDDGYEVKKEAEFRWGTATRTIKNIPYYFKEALSFPKITSGGFSARYREEGSIHESAGNEAFTDDHNLLMYLLGLTNTKVADFTFSILNPTINLQTGDFQNFPVLFDQLQETVVSIVNANILISSADWNSDEISWSFDKHPLI